MTVWRLSLGDCNRLNRLIRRWTILCPGLCCRDGIKDIQPGSQLAKDGVRRWQSVVAVHHKELGTIGVWTGICHRQRATGVLAGDRFVGEAVARAAASSSSWVSTLNHKLIDNPMKQ